MPGFRRGSHSLREGAVTRTLAGFLLLSVTAMPLVGAATPSKSAKPVSPGLEAARLSALKARSIGPAIFGGRVSEIAIDPKDPYTFYVALGTGGLMKTTDNGGTFSAAFEKEKVASIGAVAVAPSDPKVLWVGTGEANDRNSSSWGNGVYRSTDGGLAWEHVGLQESKAIARIVVHPTDPATAWAAAVGDLWSPSPGRGLYKTTDGGRSWKRVLSAPSPYEDRVGCGEVALDPKDPNVLYAALYARRRAPWSFLSGPDASDGKDLGGIFRSMDGGSTWRKLGTGLPARTGRIGLDVHAGNPTVVYAVVQSDEGGQEPIGEIRSRSGGVFRSEDRGETWARMSPLNPRPFYFSQVRVDPANDKRVYLLGFALHVSDDGGRTWREDLFKKVHPDCHALVIDPRNPSRLLLGTDGGAYQSFDGGKGWAHLNRMAAGEYYRIHVDLSDPYRICGGLQDNMNWVGPSRTWTKDGIVNQDWANLDGGDGFYCVFDPEDRDVFYAESQEGELFRFNIRTGEPKALKPEPSEGRPRFRYHWNSPLIPSRHARGVMYLAGNMVFRLAERGEKWTAISPDLSTRNPERTAAVGSGAENYGVVYALAESPVKSGLLWAGTDDGKLWSTEDDGGRWTDLSSSLPPEARGQWISRVEAGWKDPKVAYLAVDAHRSGSYALLLWRTDDGGRTWRDIAGNLPDGGPVKVVREDPVNPDVLYVGTEFGLLVSVDRGGHWVPLGNLPTVAVDDLVVHPREGDLVIATHGRSLYVLDDLAPLRGLTAEVQAHAAYLFPPRPAHGRYILPGFADWEGNAVFRGENPPEGAILNVWVREFTGDPVKLAVANSDGQPVAELTLPGTPGINRTSWNLKPTKDATVQYGGQGDRLFRAGEYEVTLTYGKVTQKQKLKVAIAEGIETR